MGASFRHAVARATSASFAPTAGPLMAGVAVAAAVGWTTPPGPLATLARVATLGLAAAFALRARRRSALVALALLALAVAADAATPWLPLAFATRLHLEIATAPLPALALGAAAFAARRADVRTPARPLVWLGVALATLGSAARVGEALILRRTLGDADTILYVLRYDMAYALWAAGALALAVAFAAARLATPAHRRRRRGAALAAAVFAFLFLASGSGALLASSATPRPALEVGYHARSASDVPEGTDLVHLEAAWPSLARAPGEVDVSRIRFKLDEASSLGVGVYLLVTTYPPRWALQKYADAVMVDADGEPFMWLDEAPGKERARVWDLSFASREVVDAKRAFVAAVLDAVGEHPAVRYVAVQNEPTYPIDWNLLRWASFDAHTIAAFRDALRAEAGGHLAWVNARYGEDFASWDDVRPPAIPLGDLGERWLRFREDLLVSFVRELVDEAKARTSKPVTVKMMAHVLTRFGEPQTGLGDRVYRAIADMSDVVSVDLYPVTTADLSRSLRYFDEIAGEKPLIVAEFNLAFGANWPFGGTRLHAALREIEEHADAVILFTATRHFLYEIDEGSPAANAARVFGMRPGDPGYATALLGLFTGDARGLLSVPLVAVRGSL